MSVTCGIWSLLAPSVCLSLLLMLHGQAWASRLTFEHWWLYSEKVLVRPTQHKGIGLVLRKITKEVVCGWPGTPSGAEAQDIPVFIDELEDGVLIQSCKDMVSQCLQLVPSSFSWHSSPGVGRLACGPDLAGWLFLYRWWSKNGFHIFKWLKNTLWDLWPVNIIWHFSIHKQFYWSTVTLVHLCIVYGCFYATMAVRSSWKRDFMVSKG